MFLPQHPKLSKFHRVHGIQITLYGAIRIRLKGTECRGLTSRSHNLGSACSYEDVLG